MFLQADESMYVGHSGGHPGFTSRTLALAGTDYIFSIIFNTNETIGFNAIRTMADIIKKIESCFSEAEAKTAIVSVPLVGMWGGDICVVGKSKALLLPLGGWQPVGEAMLLEKRKDENYYSDKLRGMISVGEPVRFICKGKTIQSMQFANHAYYPIEQYIKRKKNGFV